MVTALPANFDFYQPSKPAPIQRQPAPEGGDIDPDSQPQPPILLPVESSPGKGTVLLRRIPTRKRRRRRTQQVFIHVTHITCATMGAHRIGHE